MEVSLVGDLPGFGEVYYDPECMTNILCYHDLAKNRMIKFDHEENIFIVKLFGQTCHFVPKDKLYVFNGRPTKRKQPTQVTLPIQTVDENKKM